MDSANSGSLQSSSGGDEEYDSRAADFLTAPPFFDPLSNYLPLLNSPPAWPIIRPGPTPSPSSSPLMPSFQAAPPLPRAENGPTAARGSKKRSRASRRAPTTVLTTDTTNFRAMVQEFTGIPSPPFTSFPRNNRLDLFSTRSSAATPPPYLRRPFPQKASLLSATSSSSFQLPISQNTANLFNSSNPLLTSFLESNPKFPFSNAGPKMGGLDEQFMSVAPADTLAGLIQNNNNNAAAARWNDDQNDVVSRDDGAYKAAAPGRGEGVVESWLCSSE